MGSKKITGKKMTGKEIKAAQEQYAAEVEQRWGGTDAYKESARRAKNWSDTDYEYFQNETQAIMQAFADANVAGVDPASSQAASLVSRWQNFINDNFYPCSDEMLLGLATMYIGDERFKANYDKYGEGTAQFKHDAIVAFVENK